VVDPPLLNRWRRGGAEVERDPVAGVTALLLGSSGAGEEVSDGSIELERLGLRRLLDMVSK
jgi:hypothetical protein